MTVEAGPAFPVASAEPIGEEAMNGYFKKGVPTPAYSYAATPAPCG